MNVIFGAILLILSAAVYYLHYLIFRDAHHIFIYFVGDVGFVFVEVLLVSLIIHRLLEQREKKSRLEKINMVIGVFFSELGNRLLVHLSDMDPEIEEKRKELRVMSKWPEKEFAFVRERLKRFDFQLDSDKIDITGIKDLLLRKRDMVVRLLENPNLHEHETFTDLLQATLHAAEELDWRKNPERLPGKDVEHLKGDLERVYGTLVKQWLGYMHHLKTNYPYLFSLAVRTNPFDREANPVIRE